MDTQLKRGLFEICVLKVLSKGDSYGYQIIKDLAQHIQIAESTLYPILRRLENNDCLTVYSLEHNSRLRKYYSITPNGKKRIDDFLEEWKTVMDVYQFIQGGEDYE